MELQPELSKKEEAQNSPNADSQPSQHHTWLCQSFADDESDEYPWNDTLDDSRDQIIDSLPPNLHPAVSLGMKRVSSCYFSIQGSEASNSVADLLSLLEQEEQERNESSSSRENDSTTAQQQSSSAAVNSASDVLYHDVRMKIMTFLSANDLAAFSQTARRTNFECFYFLQLQLQRALLVSDSSLPTTTNNKQNDSDGLDVLSGTGYVTRLASMDESAAKELVNAYVNSNSTLTRMPLSHSLAYIRHVLRNHGFQQHFKDGSHQSNNALAGAAAFVMLIGAASVMTGNSPEVVLPNVLKVGLGGAMLKQARDAAQHPEESMQNMRHTAEQMARMMSEFPQQLRQQMMAQVENSSTMRYPSSIPGRMYAALTQAFESSVENRNGSTMRRRDKRSREGSMDGGDDMSSTDDVPDPLTPNPYEHLPSSSDKDEDEEDAKENKDAPKPRRKLPSGCVGAYSRAVHRAAASVTSLLKERRKSNFQALSPDERQALSTSFIDACTSDATLSIVKDMVQVRECIDVDGFYVGSDGTETCALHAAAFHGACQVLEFLCKGLDESADADGGLCDVNIRDANGWSSLHFAAGSNSVDAIKILARHGSLLAVEAANGYTPLQWAKRLSNEESVKELERLGADQRELWSQPLAVIANRFFSLIPAAR